jgi:hypothetical protein
VVTVSTYGVQLDDLGVTCLGCGGHVANPVQARLMSLPDLEALSDAHQRTCPAENGQPVERCGCTEHERLWGADCDRAAEPSTHLRPPVPLCVPCIKGCAS